MLGDTFHTILKYKNTNKNENRIQKRATFMLELLLDQKVLGELEHDIFFLQEKMNGRVRKSLIKTYVKIYYYSPGLSEKYFVLTLLSPNLSHGCPF